MYSLRNGVEQIDVFEIKNTQLSMNLKMFLM